MIPTSTNVTVRVEKSVPAGAEAIGVFVAEDKRIGAESQLLGDAVRQAIEKMLKAPGTRGKANEITGDLIEIAGKTRRIYLAGIGAADKVTSESVRQAAGGIAKAAGKVGIKNLALVAPADDAAAAVNGFLLASFKFDEYKGTAGRKNSEKPDKGPVQLSVIVEAPKAVRAEIDRARILADAQNFARTIASRPGNTINPPSLAKLAQGFARELGVKCRVLDGKELARLGMGGILAVGAGSETPPRMIVLEYAPAEMKSSAPLLVVGKTITFDTGGISIKPAEKMGRMVFDKCGGMAVLGVMYALSKLQVPIRVVGILSAAENIPSGRAYRPGDIVRMYNGVTVEVTNTDAEGRLVLGDALAWGIESFKPAAVVDLATLTGGVVIALGKTMAGVMSNNDDLVAELQRAADVAGEKIWRLPVGDDQRELMKSEPADIVNAGAREASPLQGAAFLSYFVPQDDSLPWAHVDIAGVADTEKDLPYYAKGATGWGVRTVVEWILERSIPF